MKTSLPILKDSENIANALRERSESLHNGVILEMFPEDYIIPIRGLIRATETEETNRGKDE